METKIVPVNFTDDLEELSKNDEYKNEYIGIEEISVTYIQPADTNSIRDEIQTIKLTSKTACAVGTEEILKKQGFYIDIEIPERQHWSIDGVDSIKAIIEDFEKRLYLGIENIK